MPKIAKQVRETDYEQEQGDRYVECLEQQNNTNQYQGLVSGIVNQKTAN